MIDDEFFYDCLDDIFYEAIDDEEDIDIGMLRVSAAPVGKGPVGKRSSS